MIPKIASATDVLEITVVRGQEGVTMQLRGRLSIDSSPHFRDRLLAVLEGPSANAVNIDLANVAYLDSSGIATLIEGLKVARNRHTKLCLHGLEGRLLHLFQVTGVLSLFEMSGCVADSSSLEGV